VPSEKKFTDRPGLKIDFFDLGIAGAKGSKLWDLQESIERYDRSGGCSFRFTATTVKDVREARATIDKILRSFP